jgi:hypothetical protein
MKELTSTQINIVIEAQNQILDNPVKAVVNSESAFVSEIIDMKDSELAKIYWSWSCCHEGRSYLALFNDPTIRANQEALRAVDLTVKMPSWGYSRT